VTKPDRHNRLAEQNAPTFAGAFLTNNEVIYQIGSFLILKRRRDIVI